MLPFPRFHATVHDHNALCPCAGQTTDPGSVASGGSLLYAATLIEDDREVVSCSPSAGRRCQRWASLWSSSESERTTWPKNLRIQNLRRLALIVWVTGGWAELVRRTTWLVTWAVNETCRMCQRHHGSNASSRLPDFTVTFQYILSPLSGQRLEIQTWCQWSTYRKWLPGNHMVTWPMTTRDHERSRSWPKYA